MDDDQRRHELAAQIIGPLARRHSTSTVLFHHAVAERLGLGPTDRKCLDLLLDRGAMTGSGLAAITGLTTGAITGLVARLERAGFVWRAPDSVDRRKQIVTPAPHGSARRTRSSRRSDRRRRTCLTASTPPSSR